jgi:hypothetical protein
MPNTRIISIVENSVAQATGFETPHPDSDGSSSRFDLLVGLARAGSQLSPWWSRARDQKG